MSPRTIHRDRPPSSPEQAAAKALFWEALDEYPSLRRYLVDIIETDSWDERALRWGLENAAVARKFAEGILGEWLVGLEDGAILDLLLEATGR